MVRNRQLQVLGSSAGERRRCRCGCDCVGPVSWVPSEGVGGKLEAALGKAAELGFQLRAEAAGDRGSRLCSRHAGSFSELLTWAPTPDLQPGWTVHPGHLSPSAGCDMHWALQAPRQGDEAFLFLLKLYSQLRHRTRAMACGLFVLFCFLVIVM